MDDFNDDGRWLFIHQLHVCVAVLSTKTKNMALLFVERKFKFVCLLFR